MHYKYYCSYFLNLWREGTKADWISKGKHSGGALNYLSFQGPFYSSSRLINRNFFSPLMQSAEPSRRQAILFCLTRTEICPSTRVTATSDIMYRKFQVVNQRVQHTAFIYMYVTYHQTDIGVSKFRISNTLHLHNNFTELCYQRCLLLFPISPLTF